MRKNAYMLPGLFAFFMGMVSAVLAGACVAPILIAVLLLTAKLHAEGHVLALALPFVLGLGMGLPWPFAGAGLQVLPKPRLDEILLIRLLGVELDLKYIFELSKLNPSFWSSFFVNVTVFPLAVFKTSPSAGIAVISSVSIDARAAVFFALFHFQKHLNYSIPQISPKLHLFCAKAVEKACGNVVK